MPEAAGDTLSNLVAEFRQVLAEEPSLFVGVNPFANAEKGELRTYDLPFYPSYTHLGISPSSDSCRAVPAIHYSKAIKLLFRVESLGFVRLVVVLNVRSVLQ